MALRPCSGVMGRDLMGKGAMGTDVINKWQGLFARASIQMEGVPFYSFFFRREAIAASAFAFTEERKWASINIVS